MQSTELGGGAHCAGRGAGACRAGHAGVAPWVHRLNGENPEERYRRDIWAVRRERRIRATGRRSEMSGPPGRRRTPRIRGPRGRRHPGNWVSGRRLWRLWRLRLRRLADRCNGGRGYRQPAPTRSGFSPHIIGCTYGNRKPIVTGQVRAVTVWLV